MTSWAILALIHAQYPVKNVVERGVKLIMKLQQRNGSWEQQDIEGIFNKNCAIYYPGELLKAV